MAAGFSIAKNAARIADARPAPASHAGTRAPAKHGPHAAGPEEGHGRIACRLLH